MRSVLKDHPILAHLQIQEKDNYQDFLSFIRSRLNVIGTSVYLLENSLEQVSQAHSRYIDKIKHELEVLRKMINE